MYVVPRKLSVNDSVEAGKADIFELHQASEFVGDGAISMVERIASGSMPPARVALTVKAISHMASKNRMGDMV